MTEENSKEDIQEIEPLHYKFTRVMNRERKIGYIVDLGRPGYKTLHMPVAAANGTLVGMAMRLEHEDVVPESDIHIVMAYATGLNFEIILPKGNGIMDRYLEQCLAAQKATGTDSDGVEIRTEFKQVKHASELVDLVNEFLDQNDPERQHE